MAEIEMLMVKRDGGVQGGDIRDRNGGSGGGRDRMAVVEVEMVLMVEAEEMSW